MTTTWTNTYKRIVISCMAVMIGVAAIVGGMALLGRADIPDEPMIVWDGSRNQFPEGSGTLEVPFLISTGSQLAFIADRINNVSPPPFVNNASFQGEKYFELTNDIVLSLWSTEAPSESNYWTPIGNNNSGSTLTQFVGHFDGKGHTISGLYIDSAEDDRNALFGYSTGTIKNIKLKDSYINGRNYTAGIVGITTGLVSNSHNEATITSNDAPVGVASYTGGIVGYSSGVIENCTNSGKINGGSAVSGMGSHSFTGGIVGYLDGSISNCTNNGDIIGGDGGDNFPSGSFTGGIVGWGTEAVSYCTNSGNINGGSGGLGIIGGNGAGGSTGAIGGTGGTGNIGGDSFTGGIAGMGSAVHCSNNGKIDGGIGGIGGTGGTGGNGGSGSSWGSGSSGGKGGTGGTGGVGGASFTGGIIGDGSVAYSFNYGDIIGGQGGRGGTGGTGGSGGGRGSLSSGHGTGGNGGTGGVGGASFTGGIAGRGSSDFCLSDGNIYGGACNNVGFGGAAGTVYYVGIDGSSGNGCGSSFVGGIIGSGDITNGKVFDSSILAADGFVGSKDGADIFCGGLAGQGTVSNSQIINCKITGGDGGNAANGTGGTSYTGGIVGSGEVSRTIITSCTVLGGIGGNAIVGTGGASYTGGLAGLGNVSNCHFSGSVSGGRGGDGSVLGGKSSTGGISGSGDVYFGYISDVPILAANGGKGVSGGGSFCGGITGQGNVYNSLVAGCSITGGNGGTATTGTGGISCTGGIAAIGSKIYNCVVNSPIYGGNGGNGTTVGASDTGGIVGTEGTVYNSYMIGSIFGGIGGSNNYDLSFTGCISGGTGNAENCYFAETSRINIFELPRAVAEQFPENAVDCFSFSASNEVKLSGGVREALKGMLNNWVNTPTIEISDEIELSSWIGEGLPYLDWIDETWGDPFLEYFTITFNTRGGSFVNSIRVHANSNLIAMRPVNPTFYGYTFAGWYKDEGLTKPFNFGTETIPESDITLHAKWTAKQYTIVYHYNGGNHSAVKGIATFGETLNLVVPTQELYRFDGWYSMNGETQYTNGAGKSTTAWNEDPEEEIHMIARWTKVACRIDFVTDTAEDSISYRIVDDNSNMVNERPRTPVRKGYNFDGWFKESDLINVFDFSDETPPTEDITLYAGWTAKTYTVVYHFNGGTHAQSTDTVKWGETYTFAIPKRDYYYFQGWFGFDGRQLTNTVGKSDESTWDIDINNLDLYARWEAAKYDMRFDFADGRPWATITHPYNEKIPQNLIPLEPTRDFGIFQGWFTPEGTKFDFSEMGMPAYGISLTARWALDMTKLQTLVSELQGYIDFDGFDAVPYQTFLDALSDSTAVVRSSEPQTIERVKQSHDDLLAAAIALTIADFTGKVTPPNEFRPPNAGNTWVFILLGVILLITALALTAWFVVRRRERTLK